MHRVESVWNDAMTFTSKFGGNGNGPRTIRLPKAKIRKAVELSQEKYCAVSAVLKEACPLSHDITYIE